MQKKSIPLLIAAAGSVVLTLTAAPATHAADPHPGVSTEARQHHGLGALPDRRTGKLPSHAQISSALRAIAPVTGTAHAAAVTAGRVPSSAGVDLSRYAASPGNQGSVNSCVSWAIAHSAFSILENEQGISGGPQAPMYTYSQLVRGQNIGTYPSATLAIAERQGVDARSHYWQGDYDYTTQPTSSQRANAARWRLSGHVALRTGTSITTDVQSALNHGEPVIVSIPYYDGFGRLNTQQADTYTYYPSPADVSSWQRQGRPSHEVTIVGYNSQGVKIENSWGTGWGHGGFATLPWRFLTNLALDANALGRLVQ
ncbi:C1 family peptidase [Streptomyces sp. NBC_00829]|uniref:C1 family peptidase n=1 Tax=Streptomyces sp. NBC_00829 TaxID=2903679 RepID=UPI003870A52D|nr:C1 family peptidase [Streptomyces sp. NBC_00829]